MKEYWKIGFRHIHQMIQRCSKHFENISAAFSAVVSQNIGLAYVQPAAVDF